MRVIQTYESALRHSRFNSRNIVPSIRLPVHFVTWDLYGYENSVNRGPGLSRFDTKYRGRGAVLGEILLGIQAAMRASREADCEASFAF